MTEKEKMLSGAYYDSRDPELLALHHRARDLLRAFNGTSSQDSARKEELLRELMDEVGEGVWIEPPFFCDYGSFISIGAGTFINANCHFLDDNRIRVGRRCLIGPGVHLYTAGHPLAADERVVDPESVTGGVSPYRTRSKPVEIGDRVWLGGRAIVLPGLRIGAGTTVGAGSVVTRDLPAGVLAAGNPCRVLRRIEG